MKISSGLRSDIQIAKTRLSRLPTHWDGKECVLELKAADFNWRQMEWWAFYFEHLCRTCLQPEFRIPGDRYGSVTFDAKNHINWDFKAKAIKTDDHHAILNDKSAMLESIQTHKEHGGIIALCDVEYNDENRTFQKWRTALEGGPSRYSTERAKRTSISRYRKTAAVLREVLFVRFDADNVAGLGTMNQGRNSNGLPRPPKFLLDLENLDDYLIERVTFE